MLLVGTFNWFIDPYANYWSPTIEGINLKKTAAVNKVRNVAPYIARVNKPESLILGNSRVQLGIEPSVLESKNDVVYNLGLPGASFTETAKLAIWHLDNNPNLKSIYIGLDYRYALNNYDVNPGPWTNVDLDNVFRSSIKEDSYDRISRIYPSLLSLDALNASFTTILTQNSVRNSIQPDGFNTGGSYLSTISGEGKKNFFKYQLEQLKLRFNRPHLTYKGTYGNRFYAELEYLLNRINTSNVKAYIFINPYHYSYWHIMANTNHFEGFLEFKKDAIELATKYPKTMFADFSLPNEIVFESPLSSGDHVPLKWFYEPAHYRPELGKQMIKFFNNPADSLHFNEEIIMNNTNKISILKKTEEALSSSLSRFELDFKYLKGI